MNWLCKHHFTLLLLQAGKKKIPLTSDSTHKSTWFFYSRSNVIQFIITSCTAKSLIALCKTFIGTHMCMHTHTHEMLKCSIQNGIISTRWPKKKPSPVFPVTFQHIWNGINWRLAISQHDTDKMSYSYIHILAQLLCRCKINCYFLKILQYKKTDKI
jgi:hypothetical protein